LLIKRLLILVLFVGVACLASQAQQQVDTLRRDSLTRLKPADSAKRAPADTIHLTRGDALHLTPADSLIHVADSLHREADSLHYLGDSLKKKGTDTTGGKRPDIMQILTANGA